MMRPLIRPALLLAGALAVGFTGTSCSATGVTADRVDTAVGPAFSRLYALQQQRLGNTAARSADAKARCSRNRTGERHSGAGDDWVCIVDYPYPDGHIEPVNYDVRVQPTGCYTAQGPSQVVGQQHQRTAAGDTVTNPLFEFDGCFRLT